VSQSLLRRVGTVAASTALLLTCSSLTASARPDPGPEPRATASAYASSDCTLMRIGTQLIRCDNLTGAGVPAPLWIPELVPASAATQKRGNR
jgi:hypothetical protein